MGGGLNQNMAAMQSGAPPQRKIVHTHSGFATLPAGVTRRAGPGLAFSGQL